MQTHTEDGSKTDDRVRTMEDVDRFGEALGQISELAQRFEAACQAANAVIYANALNIAAAAVGLATMSAVQAEFEERAQGFEKATATLLGEHRAPDESMLTFVARVAGLFAEGEPGAALARVMARNGLRLEG